MLYFSTILMYNYKKDNIERSCPFMPNPANKVEIHLDDKNFSMRINGAEVSKVKSFELKADNFNADLTVSFHVDDLQLD